MAEDILRVKLTAEGIQEVMNALKKVQGQTEKIGASGKTAVDALGSLGAIFAAGQIASFAKGAIDAADGLFKMSQKTGVAVEQLSALTYMGQQADLSNQDLEKGMIKLAKSLTALQAGEATATEAFSRLGLSAADLKDLSLDQALLKVANAQNKFADGAGKADVALALMGKSGANMIPLMNDLANGGFETAKKKLESLGLVLSGDMAKASQDFNDSMKRLELAAQGATVQVAQGVLPGFTSALAATPAGLKAFAGGFLVIGAAATAAAVGINAVKGALVGLGPIGLAIVAMSALVSGYNAIDSAIDASREAQVKLNQQQYAGVQRASQLVEELKKETAALDKSGLSKSQIQAHEERIKKLKEDLIKISPAYKDALDKETGSLTKQAVAAERAQEAESKRLEDKRKELQLQLAKAEADARLAYSTQNAQLGARFGGRYAERAVKPVDTALVGNDPNVKSLRDQLKGLSEPPKKAEGDDKPDIPKDDPARRHALAAAQAAVTKRLVESGKTDLESFMALTEDLYSHGLISLESYLAARRSAIEDSTTNEIALLTSQIEAEVASRGKAMTPAEKIASATKVSDLRGQINIRQRQGEEQLIALERKGRDEREKDGEAALKAEAELAAAKGRTGEAGIRAIEAEYDKQIQLAAGNDRKQSALRAQKPLVVASARLGDAGKSLEEKQLELTTRLSGVDNLQSQGLITEEEAAQKKIALYREFIPVLERVAAVQLELSRSTGKDEDLLKAQQNSDAVQALKGNLRSLSESLAYVKNAARDAFQNGLADFLAGIGDQTTSLTEKFKALGKAILNAIAQAMAMRAATAITSWMFGAPAKAEGGYIAGPGTSTSDSIPAYLSNGEFVIKAAAVNRYGAGLFDALNGLRVPRFAQGGLVGRDQSGDPRGNPAVTVNITVNNQGQASMTGDGAGLPLASRLKQAVIAIILDESRPGGVLARG